MRSRGHFAIPLLAGALLAGCILPQPGAPASTCDETLWAHVYHPDRLQDPDPLRHHQCIRATGTIASIRHEDDGDDHIRLALDPGQDTLINQGNRDGQAGDLVLEPVCVGKVTQSDAVQACSSFGNQVAVPQVGDHVAAVGVWVLDTQHGWMELHPVTAVAAA